MKLRKNNPRRNTAPAPSQMSQPSSPQKAPKGLILPSHETSPMPSRRSSVVSTGDLPSKAELMKGMMRNPYVNRHSMAASTLQRNEAAKLPLSNISGKPPYTRSLSLGATITTRPKPLGTPRLRESLKCAVVSVPSEAKEPRSKTPEKTRKSSLIIAPKEARKGHPRGLGANGSKFVEAIYE